MAILGLVRQGNFFYSREKCGFDILEPEKAFLGFKPLQNKTAIFRLFELFVFIA